MEQKAKSCYRCGREGHIVRFYFHFLVTSLRYSPYSRVIVPNLKAALAALQRLVAVAAAVLERNAIAAARSVTLRVRAPKHLEVAQEATAVVAEVVEEATVVLGADKKHGAHCPVLSCRRAREVY